MAAQTVSQLVEIFESFLPEADKASYAHVLAILKGRDASSPDDETLALNGRLFQDWVEKAPVHLDPEQIIELDRQFLSFFTGLAEKGHVYSMRYVAFAHARGTEQQTITHRDNGWSISSVPDYAQALLWCRRAADAGDEVAQRALPRIEQDAAAHRPLPPPPPPAP